jgi:integrase
VARSGGFEPPAPPLWLPLSPLARETISQALELSACDMYMFPSIEGASVNPHCLGVAMRRFAEQAGWHKDAPTPHDLRRTLRTRLSAQGTPTEVADAIMNHAAQDIGRKHYDQHRYEFEKRQALEIWARQLQAIIDGKPANVVPLRKRRRVA